MWSRFFCVEMENGQELLFSVILNLFWDPLRIEYGMRLIYRAPLFVIADVGPASLSGCEEMENGNGCEWLFSSSFISLIRNLSQNAEK